MNPDKLTKLKDQVEFCLQYYPDTRNSDITLTISVWRRFYGIADSITIGELYYLPSQDNIKRVRATFNSKGLYYPTVESIAIKRKINQEDWRKWLWNHKHTMTATDKLINSVPESVWPDVPAQDIKHNYLCEVCQIPAVIEWRFADKDGVYYTMRCADHPPVESPEYQPNPL